MERYALLKNIEAYLIESPRRSCDTEEVGPFTTYFRRDSTMPELSYAIPTRPLEDRFERYFEPIVKAFALRNRQCRFEFLADLNPRLEGALVAAGFPQPAHRPLMAISQACFTPAATTAAEIGPVPPEATREVGGMLELIFSGTAPAPDAPDLLGSMVAHGACAMAAYADGKAVSGGLHSPLGATTEVAGIGTLPEYQRRGIGGALVSELVRNAFARGCECVFLSAADHKVQRVYARIGFELIGTAMDTILPATGVARG